MHMNGLIVLIAVATAAIALCGCTEAPKHGAPHTAVELNPQLVALAKVDVASARLPGQARRVRANPTSNLAHPMQSVGCTPLIDQSGFWIIPATTIKSLVAWVRVHPTPTFIEQGTASSTNGGRLLSGGVSEWSKAGGRGGTNFVFTFFPLRAGAIGARVDAEIVPPNATCLGGAPHFRSATGMPAVPRVRPRGQ
jgi:hypothetical protein